MIQIQGKWKQQSYENERNPKNGRKTLSHNKLRSVVKNVAVTVMIKHEGKKYN